MLHDLLGSCTAPYLKWHEKSVAQIQMIDRFNGGWIEFESGESGSIKGEVELETVLRMYQIIG
jgi:hypothetical protein